MTEREKAIEALSEYVAQAFPDDPVGAMQGLIACASTIITEMSDTFVQALVAADRADGHLRDAIAKEEKWTGRPRGATTQ